MCLIPLFKEGKQSESNNVLIVVWYSNFCHNELPTKRSL